MRVTCRMPFLCTSDLSLYSDILYSPRIPLPVRTLCVPSPIAPDSEECSNFSTSSLGPSADTPLVQQKNKKCTPLKVDISMHQKNIPRRPSSTRKRKIVPPSDHSFLENFQRIVLEGKIDASNHCLEQIKWIRWNDPFKINKFDFIRSSDTVLEALFTARSGNRLDIPIPIEMRHCTTRIRHFVNLGYKQRKLLSPQNHDRSPMNLNPSTPKKCLGIDQMMTIFYTQKDQTKMCIGFGNLVRQSIRKRADLLRENELPILQKYTGVVISKQDPSKCNFTLHDTHCCNPNERYKKFAFFSPDCSDTVHGNELLCTKCMNSVLKLKKYCIHAVENRNYGESTNARNEVLLSSPSLAKIKLERIQKKIFVIKRKYVWQNARTKRS